MAVNRNFEFADTPEKYRENAGSIMDFFLETLEEANVIEEETYKKIELVDERKKEEGLENQYLPEDDEIHNEFVEKRMSLARRTCTDKVIGKTSCNSFGFPVKYSGVRYEERKLVFARKNSSLVKISLKWEYGIENEFEFRLKLVDGEWKFDEIKRIFAPISQNMSLGL